MKSVEKFTNLATASIVVLLGIFSGIQPAAGSATSCDFDGDHKSDVGVFSASSGAWSILGSSAGSTNVPLGSSVDVAVAEDYDGDGKADAAVYDPPTGNWYIRQSSNGNLLSQSSGLSPASTAAVPADYDGDGKADIAIYLPSSGDWHILQSSIGTWIQVSWGYSSAIPVPADYDGDGKTDIAVYDPDSGTWYIKQSSDGQMSQFISGWSQAIPVPADYDGDGKADVATYVPATGQWSILRSSDGGLTQLTWGPTSSIPVPGDYDGDGKADIATYTPATGLWNILRSSDGGIIQKTLGGYQMVPVMPQYQINVHYFPVLSVMPPLLDVTPASYEFGYVVTGRTKFASFTVMNSAGMTLTGTAAAVGSPFAIVSGANYALGPSASMNVVVSFSPNATGSFTGAIIFASNGGNLTNVLAGIGKLPATWYVTTNGNDGAAGTNWTTAKKTIQVAVDASTDGDIVVVSNGVYATGGRIASGVTSNRVVIDKAIQVRSVNGAAVTSILGNYGTNTYGYGYGYGYGSGYWDAVRCVWIRGSASMEGFTLANGHVNEEWFSGYDDILGGGIWLDSTWNESVSNCVITGCAAPLGGGVANSYDYSSSTGNGTLYNCLIASNRASMEMGGAFLSVLYNCFLTGNSAGSDGGGSGVCALYNCTVVGNSAGYSGGGSEDDVLNNCIIYYNSAPTDPNVSLEYGIEFTCTTPLQPGAGNITNAPQIASVSNPHLLQGSPCINAGSIQPWMTGAVDMDDEPRLNGVVDMGADEFWSGGMTGTLAVDIQAQYTNVAPNFPISFTAFISGKPQGYVWTFGDGVRATNNAVVGHAYSATGTYAVVLLASNLSGQASATVQVHVINADIYVAPSGNDANTGLSWATAKSTIQGGVDGVSVMGSQVWVSNGIYATGGRAAQGMTSNRVVIDKPVVVRSVNGPVATTILGSYGSNTYGFAYGYGYGYGYWDAVRCVWMAAAARLEGFTLASGHVFGGYDADGQGAGIWMDSSWDAAASNCVLSGNSANYGGGSYYVTLNNCLLISNSANYGGGSNYGMLNNCTLSGNSATWNGGGSYEGTLNNNTLIGNSAQYGGGSYGGMLNNCMFTSNTAYAGGGSYWATLNDCTLYGNSAQYGGGSCDGTLNNCALASNTAYYGGGSYYIILNNCTLSGNSAQYDGGGSYQGTLNNCTLANNTADHGGGSSYATLNNCTLSGNSATNWGGGSSGGTLNNCIVCANTASYGAGSDSGTLNNCTLTGNSASYGGGGSSYCNLNNCIVYFNTAPSDTNYYLSGLNYCCTTPDPGGSGNITNDPGFVNAALGNYHLSAVSPCINVGNNGYVTWSFDLDGQTRVVNATVDLGAYEFQHAPGGYWAWAAAITNGQTGYSQSATGDGYPNLLKYATGSSPTNQDGLADLGEAQSNSFFGIKFNRNTNATDLLLIVEGSYTTTNNAMWIGIATNADGVWSGPAAVSETVGGNPVTVSVQDTVPVATNRFLRLRVMGP